MKGKITEDKYLADVFKINNWKIDKNIFKDTIRKNFHNEVKGMIDLVEKLSKDYKLLLLSDHSDEWVKYINKVHPMDKVSDLSFEIHLSIGSIIITIPAPPPN